MRNLGNVRGPLELDVSLRGGRLYSLRPLDCLLVFLSERAYQWTIHHCPYILPSWFSQFHAVPGRCLVSTQGHCLGRLQHP